MCSFDVTMGLVVGQHIFVPTKVTIIKLQTKRWISINTLE